jgi:ribosomal 50S subunit-associated protein YjgA (DUF615 family)
MRGVDTLAVGAAVKQWRDVTGREDEQLEQVKRWRDALVAGDEAVLEEILLAAPTLERAQLQKLAEGAQWERAHQKPPRDFRALFGVIREGVLHPSVRVRGA